MARDASARAGLRKAFGDFQTPAQLAASVCATARARLGVPRTVVEPTCGVGGLLLAAQQHFAGAALLGVEIDEGYLRQARAALAAAGRDDARLIHGDVFAVDWSALLDSAAAPLLVLGNPPWVTNAALGVLASDNLPTKVNRGGQRGLDARTGAANFDLSEWVLLRMLEVLAGRNAAFAMLVKTSVARRVLAQVWSGSRELILREPALFSIAARDHFAAAVDACLFVGRTDRPGSCRCPVYPSLGAKVAEGEIRYAAGALVHGETGAFSGLLAGAGEPPWRSGIKHDCASILELRQVAGGLENGLGERVDLEPEQLYPLLKSSDVARGRELGQRWLLVPQRRVGEDTAAIRTRAPRTWAYLERHGDRLDARRSSIYRNRPRFSIFGVGDYAFAHWKLAISGLYKTLQFRVVGPHQGRPVVFDDTVYFLPCADEDEARRTLALLEGEAARRFYEALIFWDAKRPITAKILCRLSLRKLAAMTETT